MDIVQILVVDGNRTGCRCHCYTRQLKFPLHPEVMETGGALMVPVLALGRQGMSEVLPVIYLSEDRFKDAEFGAPLCQFRRLGPIYADDEEASWAAVCCMKDGTVHLVNPIEARAGYPPDHREVGVFAGNRVPGVAGERRLLRNSFVTREFRLAVYDEV